MKIKIPKNQSDILISKYYRYIEMEQNPENLLNVLYDIDIERFKTLNNNTVENLCEIIRTIFDNPSPLVPFFKINGVEYGFVPNMDDITFAELIDLNTDDVITQICILYRPIINKKRNNKYKVQEYKADMSMYEDFKNMLTYDILNGFITFFLSLQQSFINYTLNSLKGMDLSPKQKKILEENGDGILGFMNSVKETYVNKISF